ncbi:MAG: Methyltransferase type 11 [Bryobacterales bacterium]|nr:Methyltransferase type 11 [Bryobacterales bacterium]
MASENERVEELRALVEGIRHRVRAQFPTGSVAVKVSPESEPIRVPLADLMPVVHARDAAQAKMASIGSVNPRRGGLVNNAIQSVKRTVARGLGWFVRDQIVFNRGALACVEALMESVNDLNRSISSLGAQIGTRLEQNRQAFEPRLQQAEMRAQDLLAESRRLMDESRRLIAIPAQWGDFRADVLKSTAAEHALHEQRTRERLQAQHADFTAALERGTREIQTLLWQDMQRIRLEFERTIHAELRTIRQRSTANAETPAQPPAQAPARPQSQPSANFDYQAFADRFRGPEEYVKSGQQFYVPHFQGVREVLDIGCGRGEFLEVMRDNAVAARGIDLSTASVDYCRSKGLQAEVADLFTYLSDLPDHSLPAIFSAQVVEHLPPERLPEMIRLCAAKLERGGLIALETPNPECLAIFASHFFLDPTHTRPVPHALLAFYLEEFGMGAIETHKRFPAVESWPELNELPEGVRGKFFGGLDYAIFARKP